MPRHDNGRQMFRPLVAAASRVMPLAQGIGRGAENLQVWRLEIQGGKPMLPAKIVHSLPPLLLLGGAVIPAPFAVLEKYEIDSQPILMIGIPGLRVGDDLPRRGAALGKKIGLALGKSEGFKDLERDPFRIQCFFNLDHCLPEYRVKEAQIVVS